MSEHNVPPGENDPWFWCSYHQNVCQGEPKCKDNDGTYANHCICRGPYATKREAVESELGPKDLELDI